jgi:hypothetical protein
MTSRNTYALQADSTNPYRIFIDNLVRNQTIIANKAEHEIQETLNDDRYSVRANYNSDTNLLVFNFTLGGSGNIIGHFSVHLTAVDRGSPQEGAFHVRSNTIRSLLTRYVIINIRGTIQFSRVHIRSQRIQPVEGELQRFETLIVNVMNAPLAISSGTSSSSSVDTSSLLEFPPLTRGGGKKEGHSPDVFATITKKEGDPIFIFSSKDSTTDSLNLEFDKKEIKEETVSTIIEPFIRVAYTLLDEIKTIAKKTRKMTSKTRKSKSKSKSQEKRSKTKSKKKND